MLLLENYFFFVFFSGCMTSESLTHEVDRDTWCGRSLLVSSGATSGHLEEEKNKVSVRNMFCLKTSFRLYLSTFLLLLAWTCSTILSQSKVKIVLFLIDEQNWVLWKSVKSWSVQFPVCRISVFTKNLFHQITFYTKSTICQTGCHFWKTKITKNAKKIILILEKLS